MLRIGLVCVARSGRPMPTNFKRNIKFSPRKEEVIQEFRFDGGYVTDEHESKLKPNQSPSMENVVYDDTGSIKTRNGYLRYNGLPIGAASDETNAGTSTATTTLDAPGDYVAQTFQVGTGADIVQVDFYLEMNTTGEEQYVQAELWSGDTGPDELLSTGQILLVTEDSETAYSFRFRVPYSLSATTEYAVVLKPFIRGSTQTVNAVLVHRTGNDYASGAAYSSTDSGASWAAISSSDLKFTVYTGGSTGCTGLLRYYTSTGIQQLITKVGTSLYRGTDVGGATTAITLGSGVSLSTTNYIDSTVVDDTLLVVDGTNRIQKYRGSTNANYSTGTITATNGDATVTGSSTVWNTATNAAVGEYIQLPDDKWYKIISIASDTSLEIEVDYQGITAAGETYVISPWGEVQGDLNRATAVTGLVRPTGAYIESHIDRVWVLDGNTLRFSSLFATVDGEHFNDFDTANNAGSINIPAGKGDIGTGLYSLNNSLFIFQRRAIWRLYGTSPANFELRNVTNEIGMVNRKTLVEWGDILIFLSEQGVQFFDGSNLKNVSDGVINNHIATWANKTSASAVLWGNRYLLSYAATGASSNSEAVFLDLTRNIWGRLTGLYAGVWSAWKGGTDDGRLYFGSSNQGSIYRWDTGGHDDGYEITTTYHTPSLGFDAGMNDKAIKKFFVQQMALGDWTMTVANHLDINSDHDVSSTINLDPGGTALWDVAQWDEDSWSNETNLLTTRVAEFQGIAKYFAFEFQQTGYDEGVEILGMTVTARLRRLT